MSLFIASLNSGSNANCYYVGNNQDAVLVDAGLSCRETERRMKRLGLDMNRVRGIFISHEHSDHISGLGQLSNKHNLHVYGTPATLSQGRIQAPQHLRVTMPAPWQISTGSLTITAFSKHHDAADPVSFTITDGEVTVGVFTDLGTPCDALRHHFGQCHAAFLEANYCPDMLSNSRYPWFLRKRISGGKGHLSNGEALDVFQNHRAPFLSHLLLAHLSQENNRPELVEQLFGAVAGNTLVKVAPRFQESPLYEVHAGAISTIARKAAITTIAPILSQAALFD